MKLFFVFCFVGMAAADVYRPFDILDPTRFAKELSVHKKYLAISSRSTFTVVDKVPLYSELAKIMTDMKLRPTEFYSLSERSCPVLEKYSGSCSVAGALEACLWVRNPQRFFVTSSLAVDENKMKTLEGILKVVGSGLKHQKIPRALVSQKLHELLPSILSKVAYGPLKQKILAAKTDLSSCVDLEPSKELNAAFFELQKTGNTLTNEEKEILTSNLYALLWRMRGGGMIKLDGTKKARALYAQLPYQVLAELNGLKSGDVGTPMYWALTMKGWGEYFDLGHTPGGNDRFADYLGLLKRGLYQVNGVNSVLKKSPDEMFIAGLHFGPCYDVAWTHLKDIQLKGDGAYPVSPLTDGATSWGELCWGYALGQGLYRTLNN